MMICDTLISDWSYIESLFQVFGFIGTMGFIIFLWYYRHEFWELWHYKKE
jgi:hypothetical protein